MFEVKYTDLAARIGKLETNHGFVETPAFVPVIHPVKQTVKPRVLRDMGFELLITNAYITKKKYGDDVNDIHEIIDFHGAVMTDSGGYQVLEYGNIDISPKDMAVFEQMIGSDIAIPLDKPTGFGLDRSVAERYVHQTLEAAKETISSVSNDKTIWVGPIQGGEHLDLVASSARYLDMLGYNMFALGSPTEVMESYEFKILAQMIVSAKQSIPSSKPLHLFGAGHPLTIPLAVALGCDTFDSASYMLYARDNRYMLPNATARLEELRYLQCTCEVCSRYKVQELLELDEASRTHELAVHNLYVLKSEVNAVKQAVMEGRVWEYVVQKALSHPKLAETLELFKKLSDYLEEGTPVSKERAVFLFTSLDQYRPEVSRFRRMVQNTRSRKNVLVLLPEPDEHPLYGQYKELRNMLDNSVQLAYYSPFLGIVPEEISDIFPAAHHVAVRVKFDPSEFVTFESVLRSYVNENKFEHVVGVADDFLESFLKHIEDDKVTILPYTAKMIEIADAVKSLKIKK
ncbi:MAG: tRNA guanosine(15) transglycosylase TgtA [Nitrososphaerales archaeon]